MSLLNVDKENNQVKKFISAHFTFDLLIVIMQENEITENTFHCDIIRRFLGTVKLQRLHLGHGSAPLCLDKG